MRTIRYYGYKRATGKEFEQFPIYYIGPWWAHRSIDVLTRIFDWSLRLSKRIENKYLVEEGQPERPSVKVNDAPKV